MKNEVSTMDDIITIISSAFLAVVSGIIASGGLSNSLSIIAFCLLHVFWIIFSLYIKQYIIRKYFFRRTSKLIKQDPSKNYEYYFGEFIQDIEMMKTLVKKREDEKFLSESDIYILECTWRKNAEFIIKQLTNKKEDVDQSQVLVISNNQVELAKRLYLGNLNFALSELIEICEKGLCKEKKENNQSTEVTLCHSYYNNVEKLMFERVIKDHMEILKSLKQKIKI